MLKTRLIVFTLVLSAVAIFFTLKPIQMPQPKEASLLKQDDWQVFNSQSWRIARDTPQEQQFLDAPFMRQQLDKIYMDQPTLNIVKPDQLIKLTSLYAEVYDNRLFDFSGRVMINQQQQDSTQNHQLKTEFLRYDQQTDLLTTDQAVTLIADKQITTGVGMQMNVNRQELRVLSEVKTRYEP